MTSFTTSHEEALRAGLSGSARHRAYWLANSTVLLMFVVTFALASRDIGWLADDHLFRHVTFRTALSAVAADWGHDLATGVPGYRPLPMLTYAVDHWLWRATAGGYHVTNVLLYVLACGALLALTFALTQRRAVAGLACALFAVHPSHHESLFWVSGRPIVIATACCLFSATAYVQRRHVWGLLAFVLALASYEAALMLPLVLVVLDRERDLRIRAWSILPYAAVGAAYLMFRWIAISSASTEVSTLSTLHPGHYKLLAARLLRLPMEPTGFVWSSPVFWITSVVSATASALVVTTGHRKDSDFIVRSLLLTAIVFVPFLTQVGIADRFVFLASAGYCMGLAAAFAGAWERHGRARPLAVALGATLVVAWAIDLGARAGEWRTAGRLARQVVAESSALLPDPPVKTPVAVFGVPDRVGAALVFPTYFDRALRDEYGQADLGIRWFTGDDVLTRCRLQRDGARRTIVLWWDPERRHMATDTGGCPRLADVPSS
ncbi:MAG: hypothetical protein AB7I50_05955 [Vicinamibacterales bacterium]